MNLGRDVTQTTLLKLIKGAKNQKQPFHFPA